VRINQDYRSFLASKVASVPMSGIDVDTRSLPKKLFPWQKQVVRWALKKGRSALFLDTGLGKTFQSIAFADAVAKHESHPVLILTPLAVGPQFVSESKKLGVSGVEMWSEGSTARIQIANYQKLHRIPTAAYAGVVIDESSILKSYSGRVNEELRNAFANTRFKLACTATPSPNDVEELGNHAAFLGAKTRAEMLATYFVHDSSDTSKWRLKGHAESAFWQWVASWAMVIRHPSDIGAKAQAGYDLPPLTIIEHTVDSPVQTGRLFAVPAETLSDQRSARKQTQSDRVAAVAKFCNSDDKQWIVWCERNDEADEVTAAINGAVQVSGSDDDDDKVSRMTGFSNGTIRVLVTKPSICGFGMNWQHCDRMAFVGLSHSFEQFYQAVRRCWRFGQTKPVTAHVVTSDIESAVLENVKRKQAGHDALFARMIGFTAAVNREEITSGATESERAIYTAGQSMALPSFLYSQVGA